MPLCTTKEMLRKAQSGGYAVGAFNVENLEMMQAAILAARRAKAPVILQTTPSTVRYASLESFFAMAEAQAREEEIPIAIHLDHGNSFELAMQAFRCGYTSIMIDGSHEAFNNNIALTKAVVAACSAADIPVEAELGMVGGKEDDLEGDGGGYTEPDKAAYFIEQTKAASLAVAIGTAHGVYTSVPRLDLKRLEEIKAAVDVPLVLHGASELSDGSIKESIKRGICKVNFATELRIAYSDGIKNALKQGPDVFDPKKYNEEGRRRVQDLVLNRMEVLGCLGKA